MALPKQVEQQLREVEEMERALTVKPEEPLAETPPAASAVESAPTEVVVESQVVELKPSEPPADWEQKYRSLQGHFDREVPKLHAQNKELVTQLQGLQVQMDTLKPQPKAEDSLVTEADVEAFGADLISVQRRIAREVMRESVAPLEAEIKQRDEKIAKLEAALQHTDGTVTAMSFEQKLAIAVPGFDQLNTDPKWIAWLDETDPYTGEPRRGFAEYVYGQGDVVKLKHVVDMYTKSSAAPAVDPQETERQQRQTELQHQITPSRSSTASSTAPAANTRLYTEAEMVNQFSKVRTLNVAGKYDEAAKLEAELSDAYIQGRVRG